MAEIPQLKGADRFRIDRELADTLQGRIYAGFDLVTKRPAVIKEAWKQLVSTGYSRKGHRVPEDFLSERNMIMTLSRMPDCHGITRGIGQWDDAHCHYYAMEHCEAELFDHVSKHHQSPQFRRFVEGEARKKQEPTKQPSEWTLTVARMFNQICSSVQWMHSKGYCHLDLSLENTMISDLANLTVKIIDLGLTQHFPNGDFQCLLGRVGKLQYMCPEAYARQAYDARKADVYCLGVMLFMMLVGAPPYQAPQRQNAAFKYIMSGRVADVLKHWKRLRLLSEDAVDLLNNMLCYEGDRFSMDDVLKHPFLSSVGNVAAKEAHTVGGGDENDDDEKGQSKTQSVDIAYGVSDMSIDGNNQQSKPVVVRPRDKAQEVEAMEDEKESVADKGKGNGNGNGNGDRCVELLTKWKLMDIYDVLHATGWDHPDDWSQICDVNVLKWDIGISEDEAKRFVACFNAEFEDQNDPNTATGGGGGGGYHGHGDGAYHEHGGGGGHHHEHGHHGNLGQHHHGGVNQQGHPQNMQPVQGYADPHGQQQQLFGHRGQDQFGHPQEQQVHGHHQGQQQQVHHQQDAYQNHHINRPNHPHQFEQFHYY